MRTIAIIPAKKHSERIAGKNRLLLGGKELWRWSVDYAAAEGCVPLVSTDDTEIIAQCEDDGIHFVREVVDDSNLTNCINQVLESMDCDQFAVLQPTSPLRQDGLLRLLLRCGVATSVYTARRVKMIGHLDGRFHFAGRDQDPSTRWLYQFDGNIIAVNAEWYRRTRQLLTDTSRYVVEGLPYTLQIDNHEDFELFKKIGI